MFYLKNVSLFVVMLLGSVVAKFGIDYALIFGPKVNEKSIQNEWKNRLKKSIRKGSQTNNHVSWILVQFWYPKSTQNGPEIIPKRH